MRQELEEMERIDNYLMNKMDTSERSAFEQEMEKNSELTNNVQLQSDLIEGMERMIMQAQVLKAKSSHRLTRLLRVSLVGLIIVAVIVIIGYLLITKESVTTKHTLNPHTTEQISSNPIQANDTVDSNQIISEPLFTAPLIERVIVPRHINTQLRTSDDLFIATKELLSPQQNEVVKPLTQDYLPKQIFSIDNRKDTLIVTNEGMVVIIEKGTFGMASEIRLELKEAVSVSDLILAKLSTSSGDEPLETGGMFELKAFNGIVPMEPLKELLVSLPADEHKDGMMLFEGVETTDGSVDWVKPRELEEFLICVDIESLDFYPPDFEKTLEAEGHTESSKAYRDSLYYSFAAYLSGNGQVVAKPTIDEGKQLKRDGPVVASDRKWKRKSKADTPLNSPLQTNGLVVDPVKVKAIWNKKYNNTLLATKAFEERMKLIHQICDGSLIDVYLSNLDKPMYEIDLIAASKSKKFSDEFKALAAKRQGRVAIDDAKRVMLQEYYRKEQDEYRAVVLAAHKKYEADYGKAEADARVNQRAHNQKHDSLKNVTYQRELEMNMENAFKQIGKERPTRAGMGWQTNARPISARKSNYTFTIRRTGWHNIDRLVSAATMQRTTLNYTDSKTGKKAIIEYKMLEIEVSTQELFDYSVVYIIPSQLKTFLLLNQSNGLYSYSCNELVDYKLVYIAYKGKQAYLYSLDKAKQGRYVPMLVPIGENELKDFLNSFDTTTSASNFEMELSFVQSEIKWKEHDKRYKLNQVLLRKLWPTVYPCVNGGSVYTDIYPIEAVKVELYNEH